MQWVPLTLGVLGSLTLAVASSRVIVGHPWQALGNALVGLGALALSGTVYLVAADLDSYETVQMNRVVADVHVERTGPQAHRLTLTRLPGGRVQTFEVLGQEWRIDARSLRFIDRAVDLGLTDRVRLNRLGTRYGDGAGAGRPPAEAPSTSYPLSTDTRLDLWAGARTGALWSSQLTAELVSTEWVRLLPHARYRVLVDGTRLKVQPANETATRASSTLPTP